jgi:peptidyl-prolyl cis-trans isomerase A (cyclophilin A)
MKYHFQLIPLIRPILRSLLILQILLVVSCQSRHPNDGSVPVVIQTMEGDIHVALYPKKAPKSVAAFLSLVDNGIYKDARFYRVMNMDNQPSNAPKAEFVQGGVWGNGKKIKGLPLIPHETTAQTGIRHESGTISLARLEPGSADSEFFICIDNQPGLDYGGENNPDGQGYAAFGKVSEGMDVVRRIYQKPDSEHYLDKPVLILNIVRE